MNPLLAIKSFKVKIDSQLKSGIARPWIEQLQKTAVWMQKTKKLSKNTLMVSNYTHGASDTNER